jgi:hypothetical protein
MSLGVVIKGPEGIVLAADSRVTLEAQKKGAPPIQVNFDNATKLLSFSKPHNYVGCVTYGTAVIGLRTAHSFIPEFEQRVLSEKQGRLTTEEYSKELSIFYNRLWSENVPPDYQGPNMTFVVGGYDPDATYGKVFLFEIPAKPESVPRHPKENEFGMTWGGQLEIASRLIQGFDPSLPAIIKETLGLDDEKVGQVYEKLRGNLQFQIPYNVLPLQDCVDLAIFLIRTTMTAQNLAIGIRGVGGPIDVAVIKRTNGLQYVQQKVIHGEKEQLGERRDYEYSSDRK